jgi:hypothetical protein
VFDKLLKKLSIFLLVAVLALAGPGSAFAQEHGAEGGGEGAGAAKPPPEFEYVEMRPLVLPVITPRGLTHQVSLVISLEVPYGQKDDVEHMLPKLTDAYISELYGQLGIGGGLMTPQGLLDAPEIKSRLAATTQRVMGAEKVRDVMLQVVQMTGSKRN